MEEKIEKLYFLDDKAYPNSDAALKLLTNHNMFTVVTMDVHELIESLDVLSEKVYYHSIIPEVISLIENTDLPLVNFLNHLKPTFIKEFKEFTKVRFSNLSIPKLKLSQDDVDPLTLSNIYRDSPCNAVKIQTNGSPFISIYEGLKSFVDINELTSGLVTPATIQERYSIEEPDLYLNQDYVLQVTPDSMHMIQVIERVSNHLSWYEINELEVPEELRSCVSQYLNESDPEDSGYFYMYLRLLSEYKISVIFSGINYHIDPKNYL